jgi:hypothetical protein
MTHQVVTGRFVGRIGGLARLYAFLAASLRSAASGWC